MVKRGQPGHDPLFQLGRVYKNIIFRVNDDCQTLLKITCHCFLIIAYFACVPHDGGLNIHTSY